MTISFLQRVSLKEKAFLARQLATMLASGLTLDKSLTILLAQTKNFTLNKTLEAVIKDIEAGSPFSVAIAKYPKVFDRVFVNVVISGEAVGRLSDVLNRLAGQLEKQNSFLSKIRGAMLYPIFIVLAMIAVAILMMVKVVPELKGIFEEAGAELPWATKILIAISDSLAGFWWLYILILIGLIITIHFYLKTDQAKYLISKLEINAPGGIGKDIYMARFTRTLGMLISSGTPIIEALNITAEVINNKIYEERIKQAASQVEKGVPLSVPIEKSRIFPVIVPQMISVGEQTGKLDETLQKLADYYEEESDDKIKGLSSLFEPLVIVIIGLGVAFLVFSILLPIYQIAQIQ